MIVSLKARKRLCKIVNEIIRERKEKRIVKKDLLGHLLNSKDGKGQALTEDQIADNIIGVLFAAQDTTASGLTWILKYLLDNQKLMEDVKVIKIHKNLFYSQEKYTQNFIVKWLIFTGRAKGHIRIKYSSRKEILNMARHQEYATHTYGKSPQYYVMSKLGDKNDINGG